ncbi:MAG: hypothetical protein HOW73_48160 [Polyangiaceae bacterium]|nr:hypothetical protein [Polyangiaceae bacterium]
MTRLYPVSIACVLVACEAPPVIQSPSSPEPVRLEGMPAATPAAAERSEPALPIARSGPIARDPVENPPGTSTPAPGPTAGSTLSDFAANKPIAGCFCDVKRDSIEVEIPCGVSACIDDEVLACGADKRVTGQGRCRTSETCACSVDLEGENTMLLGCGMSTCADGQTIACSADGKTERRGTCR